MERRLRRLLCLFLLPGSLWAQTADRLPLKVNLVPDFDRFGLVPRSQGKRDTCSLFAITALAEFEAAASPAKRPKRFSDEFLIWAANEATGLKGDQAMFYEAVHGLNVFGICTADLMPYALIGDPNRRPSERALASAKTLSHRWKVHWIKRWDLRNVLTNSHLLDIKSSLARRHPVACGLRWPKKPKGHELLDVPPPDDVIDGHSIAFVGYEDDANRAGGGVLVFRNSAGANWGNRGYGLMSYAYARAYANDALWLEFGPPGSEIPIERFEAESLPVTHGELCSTALQDMTEWGAPMWGGGKQLLCKARSGGFVELSFDVRRAGRYRLCVSATAAPDYGRIRMSFDEANAGPMVDLYAGRVCPAGLLELGVHDLAAGRHFIRFKAVGKNPASTGTFFGIDTIDLRLAD